MTILISKSVLTAGGVRIAGLEVKFLDPRKTNRSESIRQEQICLALCL